MTGSLVLDRHGARDERRDDQVPKVSAASSAGLEGSVNQDQVLWVGRSSFLGLAACKMRLWPVTTFAVPTRAIGSSG
jgi:hypothetical protein